MILFLLKVTVDLAEAEEMPHLYLGGTRGSDGSSGLPAVFNYTSLDSTISDEITFIYTVESGDVSTAGMSLEVEDRSAIRGGFAPLVDLLGREANNTLPAKGSNTSLSGTAAVLIDSSEPMVTGVGCALIGGEYGVGQVSLSCEVKRSRSIAPPSWSRRFLELFVKP